MQNATDAKLEDDIFEIVNHLNAGIELINNKSEEINLARLNLIAGKKAKAANAYEPSLKYLTTGTDLLGHNSWEDNYSLTLNFYIETADVSFLMGDFER